MSNSSMLYWWPKIANLPIPKPGTTILAFELGFLESLSQNNGATKDVQRLFIGSARKIGYPLFLRTDVTSAKHYWKDTCYVECEQELLDHIYNLISRSALLTFVGERPKGLVFRKFLELETIFTAFGSTPISKEVRIFINDGKIESLHSYWTEYAINTSNKDNDDEWILPMSLDWQEKLHAMNLQIANDSEQILEYAKIVSQVFEGHWSVDFAKACDGRWYLLDMAEGDKSHVPEGSALWMR